MNTTATPAVTPAQATSQWQAERGGSNGTPREQRPAEAVLLRTVERSLAESTLIAAGRFPVGAGAQTADDGLLTDIGGTARLVSRLLAGAPTLRPITSPMPLTEIHGDAGGVAAGLRDAVRASGLFYESHLADWVSGKGTRAALLREPQAALPPWSALAAEVDAAPARLAPQAEAMVQRQLDLLERNEAFWRGQLWPGQDAEVHIAPQAHESSTTDERDWQATVRLSFPGLGTVEARIGLRGNQATFLLRAETLETARELNACRSEFGRALGAQGLVLTQANVNHAGHD